MPREDQTMTYKSKLAKQIDAWREAHPGERTTARVIRELNGGTHLGGADLRGAYLRGADLRGAYLRGAYLRGADLGGTHLGGAYLRGADLGGADLGGADLGGADLGGAYLGGAYLRALTFSAGPSGDGWLIRLDAEGKATVDGEWTISIGCWLNKTLDQLRDLIEDKVPWPEAEGAERERRRPYLRAVLALCEAHIAYEAAGGAE